MSFYPKVLILSHNILEDTNNIGKTLISLFQGWPKDRLCQIYLRNEQPSFSYCFNYYRITDKEMVKSYFKGKDVVGTALSLETTNSGSDGSKNDSDQKFYDLGNKRIPLISLVRDLLWKKKSWKNEKLRSWLISQKPDIVLFVPNDYQLIYPIVTYISQLLKIPVVPYYMDDAFYYGAFVSPIDSLRRKGIRREASKVLKGCNVLLTIGPKMSAEYNKRLSKNCVELMNSVPTRKAPDAFSKKENDEYTLVYVGNLHSNRWKTLIEVGTMIDKSKLKMKLNVYTASNLSKRIRRRFSEVESIKLKGKLDPKEVDKTLGEADALLFTESFDRKSKASTMYSLSTKIPEYINSYKPILAYGPHDISSIEYLRDNSLAIICSNKKQLAEGLTLLLRQRRELDYKYLHAFVEEHHDIDANRKIMAKILCEEVGERI